MYTLDEFMKRLSDLREICGGDVFVGALDPITETYVPAACEIQNVTTREPVAGEWEVNHGHNDHQILAII